MTTIRALWSVLLLSGTIADVTAAFAPRLPPPFLTLSRSQCPYYYSDSHREDRRFRRTEAKRRSATDMTDEQHAVATIMNLPSSTSVSVSPPRPETSLPSRRNRRRKSNNSKAEPNVGQPKQQQQQQYAQSPRDLLSDLPYLDKHQYVDKVVEQHVLDSEQEQELLPRPLSVTQASTSFMPALVLNADYQPLSFTPLSLWSWQDAIKAVFRGKVTVVDVYDNVKIRGVNVEVPLPSVIALNEYVSNHKAEPAFTKRNVFLRDEYKCQYCNGQFFSQNDLSIDHVHPRCKGGRLHWENAVTSCRICNGRKGSLGVAELGSVGMRLLRPPKVPSQYELSRIASRLWLPRRKVHPAWQPYLEQYFEQS